MPTFEELQAQMMGGSGAVSPPPLPVPPMPNATVTPPTAASSPIGRPPEPPTAPPTFGSGPTLPVTPGPVAPPSPTIAAGGTSPTRPPDTVTGINERDRARNQNDPNAGGMSGPPMYQMDHVPSASELATLPQGMTVMTPFGQMGPDGKLIPNPNTAAAYQAAIVAARKNFGWHPFSSDPNSPQPPIELGKSWINPMTGKWGRA